MPHLLMHDSAQLYYETHGFEPGRPVIVFLNGMTQTTQHWSSHTRALRKDYAVLTYDARGQGQSDVGATPLTLEQHAQDLYVLFDHLGIEHANLVGFSHGSRVALALAAQYSHCVEKLILCSATAQPTALARVIVRSWIEILKRGGLEAMSWSALPNILGEKFLSQSERLLPNIIKASVQRNTPEGVQALLEGLIEYPELNELARQVDAKTLVISADSDPLVDKSGAQLLAELAGGHHIELRQVGHTIPIEAPQEFREIIINFLNS